MTVSEAQTIRTALLAQIQAINASGIQAYASKLGISVTKIDMVKMMDQIAKLDFLIARGGGGGTFTVFQARDPE